uniref:Pancreatic trypsin inhibitor n=1 Tax=Rhipicephalus zambeziensis TaxID=60191 RepID=A0A224YBY3_9ACAR
MASIPCFFRSVHVVYVYNQYKKKCMMRYDCSYFGNKFPTLGECQRTCKKYEALREVKKTKESSSQVSTIREKIISTMTNQQKMQQSTISSVQGSLGSQTSQAQESTASSLSSIQSSQTAGHSVAHGHTESSSGVQVSGTSQHGSQSSSSSSSQASDQTSQLDTSGSEHRGQSNSGASSGSGLTGNEIITGGGQQQQATIGTTSISQSSSHLNHIDSTTSHQQSSSSAAVSPGSGNVDQQIGTGGGQQHTTTGATSTSQSSSQLQLNHSTASHQESSTISGVSSGSGHVDHQVTSGGVQQKQNSGITSISQGSVHTGINVSTGIEQHGSPVSGSSTDSHHGGNQVIAGGQQHETTSGASSSQTSSQISGSHASIGTQIGSSTTGVSVGPNNHGQQQEAGRSTSSINQGQVHGTGSIQHNLQVSTGSSSQVTTEISGSNTSGVHQTTSSLWNNVAGTHVSMTAGHGKYGACGAPLQTAFCFFEVYAMYAYDPFSGTCFMIYDCSLHGNKFRTLKACRQACAPRVKYPRLSPSDQQKMLNLTRPSQSTGQSAMTGTQIPQLPAGTPVLPASAQVSVSQGKLTPSTQQQATSAQSRLNISEGTGGQQSLTGPTEAGKQVSGQVQIGAGQVITQQSTIGGGVSVSQITAGHTAQEEHEMNKAAAIDEEWFNLQGKSSTLEEEQKILTQMKLPSVKVSKPKPPSVDQKCSFKPRTPRTAGCRQRWYYNSQTKECLPTCSKKAPFSNKIACDGVCRSLEACDFPMASLFCFFRTAHEVYIYNRNSKRCFKGYDCSNFGNKFPTLEECQNTCRLYEEKEANIAAMRRKKISDNTNNQQSVSPPSTSSAQGTPGAQSGSALPKPVQAAAGGSGDLPATVPAIQTETNNLPTSGNGASQGQAAVVVKTGKR